MSLLFDFLHYKNIIISGKINNFLEINLKISMYINYDKVKTEVQNDENSTPVNISKIDSLGIEFLSSHHRTKYGYQNEIHKNSSFFQPKVPWFNIHSIPNQFLVLLFIFNSILNSFEVEITQ